ncbi:hypothetical protein BAUCODRAFT_21786 [Baudoinia panamericana UAMH 10762]|uniref:non-specific serine/threonine protein kinase n=1 Tax=Baudoinia panamericana (strain UAMH 10762) TaxID=717646 RepID=M2NLU5_BAUPA|nr:uncharacterized protein BAUCODRAFT_21786 [Baudoinia panamericana UAMH 10762]EMD00131.1 hypothetical protein BAUCODRAFT_21786 [Baudoinia panamericana UAMH 10762]
MDGLLSASQAQAIDSTKETFFNTFIPGFAEYGPAPTLTRSFVAEATPTGKAWTLSSLNAHRSTSGDDDDVWWRSEPSNIPKLEHTACREIVDEDFALDEQAANDTQTVLNHPNLIRMVEHDGFGTLYTRKETAWEYCNAGTLNGLLLAHQGEGLPESLIWHTLVSLLQAVFHLRTGRYTLESGQDSTPLPGWKPIAHNCITPVNIFYCHPGKTSGFRVPTYGDCKLGNFTHCVVFKGARHSVTLLELLNSNTDGESTGYEAPELSSFHPQPSIRGSSADVWSVGAVAVAMMLGGRSLWDLVMTENINVMMMSRRDEDWRSVNASERFDRLAALCGAESEVLPDGGLRGSTALVDALPFVYSPSLKSWLQRMVHPSPAARPSVEEVLRGVTAAYAKIKAEADQQEGDMADEYVVEGEPDLVRCVTPVKCPARMLNAQVVTQFSLSIASRLPFHTICHCAAVLAMLDDALPTFFLKPANDGVAHHRNLFLSHRGSEKEPAYTLKQTDPASPLPAHKNCYGVAIFDAYNQDILYGEVLARPGWTQPTLSQEDIKRNGGVPPPPEPVLPHEFTIQLYNPDQQVRVELKEGRWGGSDSYEFSMPINTFRTPSASNLDRGQSDPASLAVTPKVHFAWRKESKLSKDLTCFMTGKSTDVHEKKRSRRDPDIAIALWRSLRELTVYEPNLGRVDMEDPKGLEITLLLSAVVITDLYFGGKDHMKETFNIADLPSERKLSGGGRKLSNPQQTHIGYNAPNLLASQPAPPHNAVNDARRTQLPKLQTTPPQPSSARPPPMPDPRANWALEAETARLRAQAEAEARREERRRREREKADEAEARRLQKQLEEEEKQRYRKQAEVDKETERLRKMYGVQPLPSQQYPPQANSSRPQQAQTGLMPPPVPQHRPRQSLGSNGLYMQPSASSNALVMSGANPHASSLNVNPAGAKHKKSFFGLRSIAQYATPIASGNGFRQVADSAKNSAKHESPASKWLRWERGAYNPEGTAPDCHSVCLNA